MDVFTWMALGQLPLGLICFLTCKCKSFLIYGSSFNLYLLFCHIISVLFISNSSNMHDWLPLPVFYSYHFISNLFELFLYLFPLAHFSHIHPLDFCYVSAVLFLIFPPTLPLFLWWFYFTLLFLSWASSLFTYHLFSEFLYFSVALTLQRDIYFLKVLFCFIFKFMAQCSGTIFVSFMATLFCLVLFSHDLSLPSFWFSSSLPHMFLVIFFIKKSWAGFFLYHSSNTGTFFLYQLFAGDSRGEGTRDMFQDSSTFSPDKGFCLYIYLLFTFPQPMDMAAVAVFLTQHSFLHCNRNCLFAELFPVFSYD